MDAYRNNDSSLRGVVVWMNDFVELRLFGDSGICEFMKKKLFYKYGES